MSNVVKHYFCYGKACIINLHEEFSSLMNHKNKNERNMVAKNKNKVLTCSTPEHKLDATSKDSDSICDSEASSPVPFICTQDGIDGERDVVWNFNTPTSKSSRSPIRNVTPVSRRVKEIIKSKVIEKVAPKRRMVKASQKKSEFLQDLITLNQNLCEILPKKPLKFDKPQSEEDIFSDTSDSSPRSTVKNKNRSLRKNVLSSKFLNSETDNGLESDDSINEDLIRVSQMVEEKIFSNESQEVKRHCLGSVDGYMKPNIKVDIDQDSMDAIFNNINFDSPILKKIKKCDSSRLNDDSFDNFLENVNDSALERLSQMTSKNDKNHNRNETVNRRTEHTACNKESPSNKSTFGRHNSMPESPSVTEINKPSTSGMVFGRYNTMPFNKIDDSPLRCTPDEIKKKHQQAKDKLLAKRQLPFTVSQPFVSTQNEHVQKKPVFTYKTPISKNKSDPHINESSKNTTTEPVNNTKNKKPNTDIDIKLLIEKKRQEALMKLRRRQPQNKSS